ncbi:glucose 1-dehydrogenase [Candidatus Peregrinibacteria bacterium]|nr:glucose 1-dehydrogenase [Candidatus Peregrinibacteria bacterium]
MFNLKNKTAIITGSRRGIGKGIAEVFAEAGANIVISDIDLEDTKKTADEIADKYKVKTLALKCDVSNSSDVTNLLKKTIKEFKKVDIVVNNAGIFEPMEFTKYSEKDWDKTININLKGVFLCSQEALKYMKKQKYGKIINIASIAGLVGYLGAASYCASKGAIINLTRELALEFANSNININAIAPGAIETPMTDFIKDDKKVMEQTLAGIPLKRIGKPKDIGYAACYLASDESSYVTGHTLVVDGGWISQ